MGCSYVGCMRLGVHEPQQALPVADKWRMPSGEHPPGLSTSPLLTCRTAQPRNDTAVSLPDFSDWMAHSSCDDSAPQFSEKQISRMAPALQAGALALMASSPRLHPDSVRVYG